MAILLDTHYVLLVAAGNVRHTQQELEFLSAPPERLVVSIVSIWEIALKWRKRYSDGRRKGVASPQQVLEGLANTPSIEQLGLKISHCIGDLTHEVATADPFDELLLVQVQEERHHLLTRDTHLLAHPLAIEAKPGEQESTP